MAVDEDSALEDQPSPSRRRFLQGVGATGALIVGGGSLVGSAAASVNFGAFASHNPQRRDIVEFAEIGPDMEPLEYIDDTGGVADLEDDGFDLADRDDDTEDDEPYHRIRLNAHNIVAGFMTDFPRNEYFDEDGDGDEETEVTALDPQHWTGDTGILAEDGDAMQITGAGTVEFAEFDAITSGVPRKYLFLVVDVDVLPSGETLTITIENGDGTQTAQFSIDPSGNEDNDDILATATGSGQVFQRRLGDVNEDLEEIANIEVTSSHVDIDVTIHGFDLERESSIDFGEEEYIDDDDELDSRTLEEPSGDYWITTYRSLDELIQNATIEDVRARVIQTASRLPADRLLARESDTDVYDRPVLLEKAFVFEVPTAFDLSWPEVGDLDDEVQVSSSRYVEVGVETDTDVEDWEDIDDVLDDDLLTDRTSNYGSVGDDVTLTSASAPGEELLVYYKLNLDEAEADELLSTASVIGVDDEDEGFGFISWVVGGLVGLGAGIIAVKRRAASKVTG